MKLSARNQLKGTVTKVTEGAVNGIVELDIGGGNKVSATISMASIKDLGIEPGKKACAIIKATDVIIGVPEGAEFAENASGTPVANKNAQMI